MFLQIKFVITGRGLLGLQLITSPETKVHAASLSVVQKDINLKKQEAKNKLNSLA